MNPSLVRCRRDLKPMRAVIYLPTGLAAAATWRDACGEYIQRRRYDLVGVVSDWIDLTHVLAGGEAEVAVIGRRDHMPRDRTPRIDIVTEERFDLPPTQRRPRRL